MHQPTLPATPIRYASGEQRNTLRRLLRSTRLSAATKTHYLVRVPQLTEAAADLAIRTLRSLIRTAILDTTDTQAA